MHRHTAAFLAALLPVLPAAAQCVWSPIEVQHPNPSVGVLATTCHLEHADCDASGALDVNDYVCFQNQFALGCP